MSGHKCVWAQTCVGTIVCGHNRVWAQTCVGTIMSGHNRVWAQTCLVTIVCGHNRVGSIMYGPNRGGTASPMSSYQVGHVKRPIDAQSDYAIKLLYRVESILDDCAIYCTIVTLDVKSYCTISPRLSI